MNAKTRAKANQLGTYVFFTAPATLLYCTFVLVPLCLAFYYSLHNWNGISVDYDFIGLQNYLNLFKEKAFLKSFKPSRTG